MPAKKTHLTEEERRKRIRETAREIGTSDDPEDFERAFKKVVTSKAAPSAKKHA
jgi:ABC-type antimicrobial peptide transport system ATPase subunit